LQKNITIHELAKIASLSPSTISRALRDNPMIPESTRLSVKEIAVKYGYRPNSIASSLRSGRSMITGVIVPRINRNFFSNLIGGMEEVLFEAGYTLLIFQSHDTHNNEVAGVRTMLNMRVDAVFMSLAAGTLDSSYLNELSEKKIPVFMFDRVDDSLPFSSVKMNDYEAAYLCTRHIIQHGYRKIVHFSGPGHIMVYRERKRGYLDALAESGISKYKPLIINNILTREKGFTAMHELLKSPEKADAVFSASDFSALGALLAARQSGYSIPDDIGIAGFANEPFTGFLQPGMTSIDQNPVEMGKTLARLFLQGDLKEVHRRVIPSKLIIRDSTLKPA
jgi:LacI family transcriptional regulator